LSNLHNLIFDLDGTLVDSSDGVVEAVNYALRQVGARVRTPEEIKRYIGYPLSDMFRDFTPEPYPKLHRLFRDKADLVLPGSTVALPGVSETLAGLADEGFRIAIASTKARRHIEDITEALGWRQHISVIVGGDEVTRVKPDPEAFRMALERMGAPPDLALAIGDTENDVIAARAIPMQVVGVNSPYGSPDSLANSKPDYVIESVSELPDLLALLIGTRR
jgi:2-phosphoglycolate phosphatase